MAPVGLASRPASARRALVVALVATLLAALLAVLVPTRAHAYPDPQVTCTISAQVLKSGAKLTIRCSSQHVLNWTATFHGRVRQGSGKGIQAEFTAPRVASRTVLPAVVEASFADPALGTGTARRAFDVTVTPAAAAAGPVQPASVLPNTGGPHLALLGLALLLLIAGLASVRRARRRTPA